MGARFRLGSAQEYPRTRLGYIDLVQVSMAQPHSSRLRAGGGLDCHHHGWCGHATGEAFRSRSTHRSWLRSAPHSSPSCSAGRAQRRRHPSRWQQDSPRRRASPSRSAPRQSTVQAQGATIASAPITFPATAGAAGTANSAQPGSELPATGLSPAMQRRSPWHSMRVRPRRRSTRRDSPTTEDRGTPRASSARPVPVRRVLARCAS